MKFLKYDASNTPEEIKDCFAKYAIYREQMRHSFPEKAFAFANADWHYKSDDPRCPHDAWLEVFSIEESSVSEGGSKRNMNIAARFLGAYHDGTFTLTYTDVRKYTLEKSRMSPEWNIGNAHGDWLYDEIYLAENDLVVHEIEFANNAHWTIHCKEIEYVWNPDPSSVTGQS